MQRVTRRPDFTVEVIRPDYEAPQYAVRRRVVSFTPSGGVGEEESIALIGYSFEESLHTPDSGFSLTMAPQIDNSGKTWRDKIHKMDLVFIHEFGEIRYVGFVRNRRYAASIRSDGKPHRTVEVSGSGMGAMLQAFPLVLDQFLYEGTTTAQSASKKLMARLATLQEDVNAPVAPILIAIYESYFELTQAIGLLGTSVGIKGILDHFIDARSRLSSDVVIRYPMSFSMYQVGENNIWDILTQAINPPVSELFGLWNGASRKYEIVFRQTPFDPEDWANLSVTEIPPVLLCSYDVGDSDEEVFTFYMGTLPGSGLTRNKAMVVDQGGGRVAQIDTEKWKYYGYRPMIVDFRYFHRKEEKTFGAAQLMRELSQMMKRWFEHNDEFLSGSLTFMSVDEAREPRVRNPRIGEKIRFLGGEFYVERSTHTWGMVEAMETRLGVTRGYRYGGGGLMLGKIENPGARLQATGVSATTGVSEWT